jgi:hypothetical protein
MGSVSGDDNFMLLVRDQFPPATVPRNWLMYCISKSPGVRPFRLHLDTVHEELVRMQRIIAGEERSSLQALGKDSEVYQRCLCARPRARTSFFQRVHKFRKCGCNHER